MSKDFFTIFGQGFVGTNFSIFLKKNGYKFFFPKKGKYKFNKNLNHVIYCIGNQNWLVSPKRTYNANLAMVANIIFNNKFKSFTLISSTRLYLASLKNKTSENDLISTNTTNKNFLYNSLKIAAENLCLSLDNKNIKVVRISNLFGDNFTNQAYLLPTWIRSSILSKKINLNIKRNSSKDFIYVDDAFKVLLKIIQKGKFRLYNVAFGKNTKLVNILKEIKKITDCKISYKKNSRLVIEPKININRIRKEFNFKANNNLIDLLKHLIINYKNSL